MSRSFSIITTSMGRLDHLRRSLPAMTAQAAAEIVVVDYSCPQQSGEAVRANWPDARVVEVAGKREYSLGGSRNAGAAEASGDVLVFCDADTILADGALSWIADNLPERAFGAFTREATAKFNTAGLKTAWNQLRGFHVVPSRAFRRVGGYDEVPRGWGTGADTDLEQRLGLLGLQRWPLDPAIIADMVQHGDAERTANYEQSIALSYSASLIYRAAKSTLLKLNGSAELPLDIRKRLYAAATHAAGELGSDRDSVAITVDIGERAAGMPLQIGYREASCSVSLRVELSGRDRVEIDAEET